jgi:hypothetical protein
LLTHFFFLLAGGQVVYNLKRRIPLGEIASLSLSTLQDNYVVIHHNQYDMVFENDKKTEIVTILMENYKMSGGRDLPVNFNDKYVTLHCVGSPHSCGSTDAVSLGSPPLQHHLQGLQRRPEEAHVLQERERVGAAQHQEEPSQHPDRHRHWSAQGDRYPPPRLSASSVRSLLTLWLQPPLQTRRLPTGPPAAAVAAVTEAAEGVAAVAAEVLLAAEGAASAAVAAAVAAAVTRSPLSRLSPWLRCPSPWLPFLAPVVAALAWAVPELVVVVPAWVRRQFSLALFRNQRLTVPCFQAVEVPAWVVPVLAAVVPAWVAPAALAAVVPAWVALAALVAEVLALAVVVLAWVVLAALAVVDPVLAEAVLAWAVLVPAAVALVPVAALLPLPRLLPLLLPSLRFANAANADAQLFACY